MASPTRAPVLALKDVRLADGAKPLFIAGLGARPLTGRAEGPLIPAAPPDTVAALGALDRRLYVSPSRQLVVVRTGAETKDQDFDQQLWLRLAKVLDRQAAASAQPGQEASR